MLFQPEPVMSLQDTQSLAKSQMEVEIKTWIFLIYDKGFRETVKRLFN